jgi:carbamoyltransferase
MSYNILGINTSHNGSVCVLKDGEIDFFLEEERISKDKTDTFPIEIFKFLPKKYKIDEIAVSGLGHLWKFKELNLYKFTLGLLYPNIPVTYDFLGYHHLCHTLSSFYNSKFEKCLGVVVDGNGSYMNSSKGLKAETESIFVLDYLNSPTCIYKSNRLLNVNEPLSLTKVYELITESLGFQWDEAGKTMGLSSYGKPNSKIPSLYLNGKGNPLIFKNILNTPSGVLKEKYQHLLSSENLSIDLAYKLQQESQQAVGDLIEKGLKETGLKQVCCSGGYFLNCVANYYLTKRFPNIEFYFEPISSDAGVAIGAAKLAWYQKTRDITKRPQKTLYYGPRYTKEQLLEGIKKYLD